MTEQERHLNQLPKIHDIPLKLIDDFPDHPYKVRMDEDMMQLIESVKERGVIVPVALRQKEDGRYEIVSGHRRKKACELAGLETVPAEIKDDVLHGLYRSVGLKTPGQGIAFSLPVSDVAGLAPAQVETAEAEA